MVMGLVLLCTLLLGWLRRVAVFDCFCEGAQEGLSTTLRVFPSLLGLLVAIGMLRASGAMDGLVSLLSPLGRVLGIPPSILPLALMRPISGSGSLALVQDVFNQFGADSFIGRVASLIMGSSETTFYTIAVYFGSVGVRKTRHTVGASLLSDLCATILAVAAVRVFFE